VVAEQRLLAPWRMKYVQGERKDEGCIVCLAGQAAAGELLELMTLAQRALHALHDAYHPHGFNLGVNEGQVAGAGFAGHVHLHVVPRWTADSNFMAVTGATRVLPQSPRGHLRDASAAAVLTPLGARGGSARVRSRRPAWLLTRAQAREARPSRG
jgi:hypothetical protein